MKVVKHPTIAGLERTVPDGSVASWEAAGWLPATEEIRAESPAWQDAMASALDAPCPTCGASGDQPCSSSTGANTARHATRKALIRDAVVGSNNDES